MIREPLKKKNVPLSVRHEIIKVQLEVIPKDARLVRAILDSSLPLIAFDSEAVASVRIIIEHIDDRLKEYGSENKLRISEERISLTH